MLPSFRFYPKLDEGYDLPHYHDDFFEVIEDRLRLVTIISSISEKLLRSFYQVTNMRQHNDQYSERWNYLYYWMGDKVYNIVDNKSEFSEIMDIVNSVKRRVDTNNEKYNEDFFNIEKNEFIKLKKLYDYSQNYDAIQMKVAPSNSVCSHLYHKYMTESYELYSTIKTECSSDTKRAYCRIFRNIENNNLKDKTSRLMCFHINKPVSSEEGRSRMQHGLTGESSRRSDEQGSPMGPRVVSSLHGSPDSEDNETSITNSSNSTAVILPIFGLFCTFFILYKFTPLGTLIHGHFLKRKINQWNEETVDESLAEKYKPEDDNSLVDTHNISYNPIGNR
ncbi:PIR protein [Plasmodium ovale]|uniref:PIR protein n=2 Tax=Plasmodium ovale TaxID=36330 RepID=A0A1D3JER8_PLAOA|nr:PIR protein [Plasmodium ovale]